MLSHSRGIRESGSVFLLVIVVLVFAIFWCWLGIDKEYLRFYTQNPPELDFLTCYFWVNFYRMQSLLA